MTDSNTREVRGYHAHVYFDASELEHARSVCEAAEAALGIKMGRMHAQPVGPHPRGSCQFAFAPARLGEVTHWFFVNRQGLTVFLHGRSGDDLVDHTELVGWIGESEALHLALFEADAASA